MSVGPEGGQHLGPDMLKAAERPVSRLEASVDSNELLVEGPGHIGCDFCTSLPSLIAASLDGLAGGNGVARKEVCIKGKRSLKPEAGSYNGRRLKERKDNSPSIMSSISP